jgi:hypothetical protein
MKRAIPCDTGLNRDNDITVIFIKYIQKIVLTDKKKFRKFLN